ncbi:MAG TPA: MBL fold metallo-hydrolase [Candidatus Sulfomarinibacteraceae bacterium]|nr:MBL fold metallo-hydrolase [Candidatus Sulfomarinibacteraceae bacterium]
MTIHTIDLNFLGVQQAIASYLVQGPEGWLLVETGPMSTLERLRQEMAQRDVGVTDVDAVLVTHIHLDHAGAAGWWAQQGVTVHVHHVGAPHLIDPSRLWHSAGRIYGEQMETLWGEVVPAPRENVVSLRDGDIVQAAGLTLTALDTPGHAWHHHVYRLEDAAFSGDAAGVRVPGSGWVSLPAPPPELDLEAWHKTLDRLEAEQLQTLYLTHFGRVDDVDNQLQQLREMMEEGAQFVRRHMQQGSERNEIIEAYTEWNRRRALAAGMPAGDFEKYEAANPLFMSVDGLMRYWRKRKEAG